MVDRLSSISRRICSFFFSFHFIWTLFNGFLFWNTYRMYKGQPQYYYLYQMLGSGLCISRGSGAVLNVNCALVLVPTCKRAANHVRYLLLRRGSGRPLSGRWISSVFNQAETIHVTCAVTIVIASAIHTGAHLVNAINFSRHYNPVWNEINLADYAGQNPLLLIAKTGVTGVLMMLFLTIIMATSSQWFRSRHYNTFYYAHHVLFGPFLLLLILHPISGILKEQINWADHPPGTEQHHNNPPVFVSMETHTWLWITVPLLAYTVDLAGRKIARRRPVLVHRVTEHGNSVVELAIDSWMDKSLPGQYVMLQCPVVSGFEWHPFSFSSCCDVTHPRWTIHFKIAGDWCKKFKSALSHRSNDAEDKCCLNRLELYVDGPFTSPLVDVLYSRTVICIAGGIGFTPFLAAIHHLIRNGWSAKPLQLHVVWCVRSVECLSWAAAAIDQLIEDAWASPRPDKLEVRLYVTRSNAIDLKSRAFKDSGKEAAVLLKHVNVYRRIECGRPDWSELFNRWRDVYVKRKVNVYTCGPSRLNRQIEQICRPISNFSLASEHFS